MEHRDIVIIGGGPAGYVCAIRIAQLGGKATIIEQDVLGGVCLNRGCIPTKALARGAEFVELAKKAREYGVDLGTPMIDFAKMIARKNIIVKTIVGGVQSLIKANGIEALTGKARFLSPLEIEAELNVGSKSRFKASKVIVSTGCGWNMPDIPGAQGIITTDQALNLGEIPESLLIIGGSDVGFAFAAIFAKLGASVSIAEASADVLPGVDRELVEMMKRDLRKDKINLFTEAVIKSVKPGESAVISMRGEDTTLPARCVLLAEGRKPNVDGFGLEKTGARIDGGRIAVNDKMETGVSGLYAAGDVIGGRLLAHVAMVEGKTAAENAMGVGSRMDYSAVPMCIGTMPEIACVGLTEADAAAAGYDLRIGRFTFGANGMATALGERTGMIKIVSEAKYGQILGVHIIGPQASNLIAEAVLAMKLEATPLELGSTIHAHPTLSEAMMEAALDARGETIHSMSANKR